MQPVLWTKGVVLTPQHLQTQDRFLEDLLEFQLSSLTYAPWGFHRLEIDREALASGAFALAAASGIFADGLLFDIPGSDAPPPPKPLEGAWDADRPSLDVYLAIPEHRPGGYNVSLTPGERPTRYLADVLLRRDENTGLAEKPLQVARKNFRFLVEGESREGSSSLRVARVTRSRSGEYQLDPRCVPPLIDIAASEHLLGMTRRLVEVLTARSSTLSGMRRQRNQGLADFTVADVANFWLLYTVNTYLPQFHHVYEVRRGHPAGLYATMVGLAGALTTFSSAVQPKHLLGYDHEDPGPCFADLDAKVRELLETVVPVNYVSLPLTLTRPGVYATAIDQDRYLAAPQMFLAVRTETAQAELIRDVPRKMKVSSGNQLDRLIKQALPGMALTHLPSPPSAVPVKANYQYFQLARSGTEWEAVKVARHLAAYVPAEFASPQLELVLVLPPKA
ncbi:MAG TPA: type VI secretion system baseplate subunit TssK [Gemmatimonadales bacterium]